MVQLRKRRFGPARIGAAVLALAVLAAVAVGAASSGGTRPLASRQAQLPGGGRVLFPGHLLVALYGHPGTPSLGALGQQDLPASITRAQDEAKAYRKLTRAKVIPAFEIIATVAAGSPGPDGDYSYQTPVAVLRPWVLAAQAAGMYVILDLQAGRASLLAQAQSYESLLELPGVGLALDPEWKLAPGQLPLQQIGGVSSSQVQTRGGVAGRAHRAVPAAAKAPRAAPVPPVDDPQRAASRYPVQDLAILVHMDGQGTPAARTADLAGHHDGRPRPGCSSAGRTSSSRTTR